VHLCLIVAVICGGFLRSFFLSFCLKTIILIGHVDGPKKFGSLGFIKYLLNRDTMLFAPEIEKLLIANPLKKERNMI